MKICICGWYYNRPLFEMLIETHYDAHVVGHRDGETLGIPKTIIENIGLEFHAYDYYLKRIWDVRSDVLFLHDDTHLSAAWDLKINLLPRLFDQVFIYTDGREEMNNGGGHGRAFFCTGRFLYQLLENGGFWYDKNNTGQIDNDVSDGRLHHNAGILSFLAFIRRIKRQTGWAVGHVVNIPDIKNGFRGGFK